MLLSPGSHLALPSSGGVHALGTAPHPTTSLSPSTPLCGTRSPPKPSPLPVGSAHSPLHTGSTTARGVPAGCKAGEWPWEQRPGLLGVPWGERADLCQRGAASALPSHRRTAHLLHGVGPLSIISSLAQSAFSDRPWNLCAPFVPEDVAARALRAPITLNWPEQPQLRPPGPALPLPRGWGLYLNAGPGPQCWFEL